MNAPLMDTPGAPTRPVAALAGTVGSLLMPLLRALGNDRSAAVIASAVPDPERPLTFGMLAVTLGRLGYDVCQGERARDRWHQAIDGALVLLEEDRSIAAFVRQAGRVSEVMPSLDSISIQAPEEAHHLSVARRMAKARRLIHLRNPIALPLIEHDENLRRVLAGAYGLSLFINLIALSIPYLTMVVYNYVIGGMAPEILPGLGVGGFLALATILVLRRMRAVLLADAFGRFGYDLQSQVAQRLLRAPLGASLRFQVYALLARVREAWRGVDPLSNAFTGAIFDSPFILFSLLAIAFIGGVLVVVPVFYLLLFFAIALLVERRSRLSLQIGGAAMADREAMLAELAEKAVQLRVAGLYGSWLKRFDEVSQRVTATAMANATRSALTQSVAYVLGTGVALATLLAGIVLVLDGQMTAGGLIAVMLLVWRIVGPAQAVFFSIDRLRQTRSQRQRIETLLQTPVEADRPTRLRPTRRAVPQLRFDRVSYRYAGASEQALTGVSFVVDPGEIVAVLGPSGSGKTTVLAIAAGLLAPQLGLVLLDGRNLAHFDPDDHRLTVAAFVPTRPYTFDASLKDNIVPAAPWADDDRIAGAVRQVWPGKAGEALAADLAQPVPQASALYLSAAEQSRLAFARLAAKSAHIAIVDAPFSGAEPDARRVFEDFLVASRSRRSVLFSTADPAMARFADKVLILNAGVAAYYGPPAVAQVPLQAAR
jgi:ATP-binding cassette subfamily C protein/ATP-binding cassette subfamily C protein LapB